MFSLGAVIEQYQPADDGKWYWKPIEFASRTLRPNEQSYAQIEKECLGMTWSCERFHKYLMGLETFKLITDHKPLIPILNSKELSDVALRCQRLLIRLRRYSYVAEHSPGKNMLVFDTLS